MRTIVKGKNFEVPERTRRYAERRLKRLERLLDDRSDAIVELSVEHHRSAADSQIVQVTLVIDGRTLRSHAAALTHEAGVDTVVDKVERQAVDFKRKPRLRARPEAEVNSDERAPGRRVHAVHGDLSTEGVQPHRFRTLRHGHRQHDQLAGLY